MVWAAGQRLQNGKYIIEKILGEGGFGITYKARHTLLQQLMVIKTPNERLKNDPEYPKYLQRFVEEGRRLEKLSEKQHPNIVRVRDLFEEGGIYCLVMDFVSGESLFDLVRRRGALPPTEAVEYVRQIGEALTVVHQARLVHRDAHPGNIMVQKEGKAVLIDFGIAGEILQTVESSKHFGNIAFAPYEQMMGSREPTVDVYCLAASLYYAVTGQCPTSSLDRKLKNVGLFKPKQHVDISDELNRAILKGMELEAKNRPQSMQEWLKLLEVANCTVRVSLPPKKQIRIPWVSLTGLLLLLLSYAVFGFLSAPSAWTGAWVSAWVFACILTLNLSDDWFETLVALFPGILFLTSFSPWRLPMNLELTLDSRWFLRWIFVSLPSSGIILAVWLGISLMLVPLFLPIKILFNSFSNFHIRLILLVTCVLGLALGWLPYQIFPIIR